MYLYVVHSNIYKRVEEGSVMPLLRSTWEKVVQAQR